MNIEDSIIKLGKRLDDWCEQSLVAVASRHSPGRTEALRDGLDIVTTLNLLKTQGLATVSKLLNHLNGAAEGERASSLIRAFEFAAKLAATLNDELLDTDGYNKVVLCTDEVAEALDAIGSGRAALAVLLDHNDARVRAFAGAYLIELIPERVVPILREIEVRTASNSAASTAHWTLLRWEREGKHSNTT
jgi:hypothetical protein